MVRPKKILNDDITNSVDDYIDGLLYQYPNHYRRVSNHPIVVLASHFDTSDGGNDNNARNTSITSTGGTGSSCSSASTRVHILSGGGSGHEPSHAGWIGVGMLTGVICGGIFASPSVTSILTGIRIVASSTTATTTAAASTTATTNKQDDDGNGGGILCIVKNYTGDRLNFGMAVERANQEGILTTMVIVADDCALPRTKGITGARGVAGTVLIHKIAGAAAARGMSLQQVADIAKCAANRCGTLGIALNSVTVPGADVVNDRLADDNTIEIGLGIHGEAGMKQSPMLTANEMAREMISTIQHHGRVTIDQDGNTAIVPLFADGDDLCILVNNLGGTSNFEMSILTKSCIELLESTEYNIKVRRVLVGSYMTSFDMQGVSVTILNLSGHDELIELLDAPTNAPAWTSCDVWRTDDTMRPSSNKMLEIPVTDMSSTNIFDLSSLPTMNITNFSEIARNAVINAVSKVAEAESLLTKYDTIVGDGDCGMTMKRGATEILSQIQNGSISTTHPIPMFIGLADAVSASMGGTSGILIELMLRKLGSSLRKYNSIGIIELCAVFQIGVDAISMYGGAQAGSRTMLDALVPAAKVLIETNDLVKASRAARDGANTTMSMSEASAGRSNYLSGDTLVGTPDPGAVAAAIVLEALAESCC